MQWRCLFAGLASLCIHTAYACTSALERDPSGFPRQEVTHLPKNARGVIFSGPKSVQPSDFSVHTEDGQAVRVHLHQLKKFGWVRVEPVGGFTAGKRYTFVHRHADKAWKYPGSTTVLIDDAVADPNGPYAFDMAPKLVHGALSVPTSGSCTAPAVAVIQEFTYATPASIAAYRDVLLYRVGYFDTIPVAKGLRTRVVFPWRGDPLLFSHGDSASAWAVVPEYSTRFDAVYVACGSKHRYVYLDASVAFPELADQLYPIPKTRIDFARPVEGECGLLEGMLRTMANRSPDLTFQQLCGMSVPTGDGYGKRLNEIAPEEWASMFTLFHEPDLACAGAGLGQLWSTDRMLPDAGLMQQLGDILKGGFSRRYGGSRTMAVHVLVHLVDQMPAPARVDLAARLLGPSLPSLVAALAMPHPERPDELARLIMASGALPPEVQAQLSAIAQGTTRAAVHARAILTASAVH